ncbi:glycoside hydrolase family 26 protein [Frigoribacterium sp. CFBP 8751]|uniref:glycoside hydrolase family 26 protein n=1 Tax=Frigoribacterium sp. CFBP 8751 TaxID=2775277 RepID=UPI002016E615|nr:glycosyl hydrolase [Frigoribacterium sp. CFBP 8751]
MSDSTQDFVTPVHLQSGAWWATSHGNARRTALGATAVVVLLAMISWLIWVSPSDNIVRSAVTEVTGVDPSINVSSLKADRSALLDQLVSAKKQLAESKAALADVQQQAWTSEGQLTAAQAKLASAESALAQAQSAADAGQGAGSGSGAAGTAAGGRGGGNGASGGSGSGGTGSNGSTGGGATGPVTVETPSLASIVDPESRYFGLFTDQAPFNWATYDAQEAAVGSEANMVGYFQGFDQEFRADAVRSSWSRGKLPVLTWESQPIKAGNNEPEQPDYSLTKIIDGSFDSYLTTYADDIVANGMPLALRFDHEMNGTWYPWSTDYGNSKGAVNGNGPDDYVKAWQHVHDLFERQGANDLVAWIWAPTRIDRLATGKTGGSDHTTQAFLESLYPGADYVDIVGMSGYYRPPYDDKSKPTFDSTFGATLKQLRAIAPGKNILLAEIGASETGGSSDPTATSEKAQWFNSLFEALADPANDDIIGFSYFDLVATTVVDGVRSTNDWRLTSRSDSLAAFTAGITRRDVGYDLQPSP